MRRSLLLLAPRRLEWVGEPLTAPGEGELLVETLAGAISVGSELPLYRGDERASRPTTYPRMTGYESLGVVRSAGSGVSSPAVGERVVATYGHRDAALVPAAKAIPVPPGLPDELALLGILSCDVAKGIGKLAPRADEPVLISGAGTIGLLTLWVLRAQGVRTVDVIEPLPERRVLAETLGAAHAWTPGELTGDDYAAGFECSGRDAAFARLQRTMRHDGRICILSDGNVEPLTLTPEFHARELAVVGSSDGLDYQAHARWFFPRVQDGRSGLERLFDCHVTTAELPATFERLATGELRAVKVLVRY